MASVGLDYDCLMDSDLPEDLSSASSTALYQLPMATDGDLQTPLSDMTLGKDLLDNTKPEPSSYHSLPFTIAADGTPPPPTKETTDDTSSPPERPTNTNATTHQILTDTTSLDPTSWAHHRKITLTTLCCLTTFLTGWNATALTATTAATNTHFSITDTTFPHSVWALTSWNLGAALAPMLILPLMEDHGTRPGYLAVYSLFVCFVIPQPLTDSYAVFCGVRFLAGCCAGVLQTCMDGVIADVWRDSTQMSVPVSCYVGALLAGVSSGPVFGGVVSDAWGLGWRWILYFQLIIYGVLALPVYVLFAETRLPVIRAAEERREKRKGTVERTGSPTIEESRIAIEPQPEPQSTDDAHSYSQTRSSLITFLRSNILRPFHLLATEPVVLCFTLLSALSYGITFLSTQSIPQVYAATYHFSEPETAYIQAAIVLGELVGWAICVYVQDPFYARCARIASADEDRTGRLIRSLPEKRLYAAVPASFLALAAGLFVYGFTAHASVSLYAPTTGIFLIGVGVVVVMQAIMMYVTDSYARYAASASAAVCFGENMFAAFLPLGSSGMYSKLGFGWASGLLGFVALLLGLGPVVLVFFGESVRARSRFMRTL